MVEIQNHGGLGGEVRVAGKIHDWYRQGLTGCSVKRRRTDDDEMTLIRAWDLSSAASFRSGPG
jgi:hypothetical protein